MPRIEGMDFIEFEMPRIQPRASRQFARIQRMASGSGNVWLKGSSEGLNLELSRESPIEYRGQD